MCPPQKPSADHYDTNYQVKPHFSRTPGLTKISPSNLYSTLARAVKREIFDLYRKHGLSPCPHYGIYYAGSKRWTNIAGRDKTMLLVIELKEDEIKRWWEVDGEVRRVLEECGLSGKHGVCVRYYRFWAGNTDGESPDQELGSDASTQEDGEEEGEVRGQIPAPTNSTVAAASSAPTFARMSWLVSDSSALIRARGNLGRVGATEEQVRRYIAAQRSPSRRSRHAALAVQRTVR